MRAIGCQQKISEHRGDGHMVPNAARPSPKHPGASGAPSCHGISSMLSQVCKL